MGLEQFLIALVVVGGILFLIRGTDKIDPTIKLIVQVVLVIVLLIVTIKVLLPMSGLG